MKSNYALKGVLQQCKKTARDGYKRALAHEKRINETLEKAETSINEALIDFRSSTSNVSDTIGILEQQLFDINNSFQQLSFTFKEDLNNLHEKMSKFSITLFGRTMAGKSTLMEILTEGDGKTIGQGAQRTTRDIRSYMWNNLEITDVPGIGAFDGDEDEMIAFEVAKQADLILFIFSDDAPQALEAECFSRIVELGKPIICIMNVKVSISETKSMKLIQRDINKRFDLERLDAIKKQFLSYAEMFGQNWAYIPFVNVHLRAAYLAQKCEDIEKRAIFEEISGINLLKQLIIDQVINNGKLYREKTFIDIILNPMIENVERLLLQGDCCGQQKRVLIEKANQIEKWGNDFVRDKKQEIKSFVNKVRLSLYSEVASFAEEHYEDEKVNESWNCVLNGYHISEDANELLISIEQECIDRIVETNRELENELSFVSRLSFESLPKMHKLIDFKKVWDWAFIGIDAGVGIGAIVAYYLGSAISGPLGWAALGIGVIATIGSFILPNIGDTEHNARKKLDSALRKSVTHLCDDIEKKLMDAVVKVNNIHINRAYNELHEFASLVDKLSMVQTDLAWKLNKHVVSLNSTIIEVALNLMGSDARLVHINKVGRLPGIISLLCVDSKELFTEEFVQFLSRKISEQVIIVEYSKNRKELYERIFDNKISRKDLDIDNIRRTVKIRGIDGNIMNHNLSRITQQITETMIIE